MSTHSPVVVDEARFGEVVLVRDHRFYVPRRIDDADTREEINTALLTGHGSEMAFSSSALLVEGEGDRLFFEGIRRRLAIETGDGRIDQLSVVPVGGKERFGPWLRLLRSYGEEGNRPIHWLLVADDDAAKDVRRAYRDAGITLPIDLVRALQNQSQLRANSASEGQIRAATVAVNRAAEDNRTRLFLLPGELEGAMTESCAPATARRLGTRLGRPDIDSGADLCDLCGAKKAPWVRGVIADQLPWRELAEPVRSAVLKWLEGVFTRTDAEAIGKEVWG